jgi:hypothetical protein
VAIQAIFYLGGKVNHDITADNKVQRALKWIGQEVVAAKYHLSPDLPRHPIVAVLHPQILVPHFFGHSDNLVGWVWPTGGGRLQNRAIDIGAKDLMPPVRTAHLG